MAHLEEYRKAAKADTTRELVALGVENELVVILHALPEREYYTLNVLSDGSTAIHISRL